MSRVKKSAVQASIPTGISTPPDQRAIRRANRGNGEVADWSNCSSEQLRRAVAAVARTGGAIRLGYSRDKGAFAIGLLGDGEPYTDFVRPSESIDDYLTKLAEDYEKYSQSAK